MPKFYMISPGPSFRKRPGCGKPYVCPVPQCNKAYKNPNGIKYHAQYGHSERQEFACSCGKVYSTRHGLMAHKKSHENPEDTFKRTIKAIKAATIQIPCGTTTITTFGSQAPQLHWEDLDQSQKSKKCFSKNEFELCKELADHIYALNTHEISTDELGSGLWENNSSAVPDVVMEENSEYSDNNDIMSFSPLSSMETDFHFSNLLSDIDIDDYPDIKIENVNLKDKQSELDTLIIDEADELSVTGCSSSSDANSFESMDVEDINVSQVLLGPCLEQGDKSTNGEVKTEHCYEVVFPGSQTEFDKQEKMESSEVDNSDNGIRNSSPESSFAKYLGQCHEPFYNDAKSEPMIEISDTTSMPIVTDYWGENRSKPMTRTGKLCDYSSSVYDRESFCNSTTSLKSLQDNVDSIVAIVCAFGGCYELFTTPREYEHHINEIHPEGQNKMKYFERLINEIMNPDPNTDSMDFCEYYFGDIENNIEIEKKQNQTKKIEMTTENTDAENTDLLMENRSTPSENDNAIPIPNPNVIQYRFEEIRFKQEVTDGTPTKGTLNCRESRKRRRKSPILKHLYEEENSVGMSFTEDTQQFSESNSVSVEQSPTKENEVNATEESVEHLPVSEEDNDDEMVYYSAEFILEGGLKKRPGCGKPYVCPVPECDKAYKNPNGIKYHAQYGHSEKQELICTCGRIYQTRHGLMAHKKSHESPEERLQRSRRVKNGTIRKTRR